MTPKSRYAVFGKVIKGIEVVDAIAAIEPESKGTHKTCRGRPSPFSPSAALEGK